MHLGKATVGSLWRLPLTLTPNAPP
jgi:hypothetical protein